ncbi:MAG: T9SS type A sorting domain-containing protein, partial [candidate division WOR-3 bacterium]
APKSVDTLEFAAWTVTGRDSMRVTAWTNWAGDSVPEDDTLSRRFLVRVVDVGITEVFSPVPWDTIDPDTVFPSCVVWNYGNITVTFPMVFNIGLYCDTLWVRNLVAGGSRPVTAVRPWTAMPGTWQCLMNAALDGDLHPENNDTTYWFVVRGTINHDIMVGVILVPSGVMDTTPFLPTVEFHNNGAEPDSFWAWFWITDTVGSQVYMDSLFAMLFDTLVTFRPCTLRIPGYYMASCSVYLAEDQNRLNDVRYQGFWVAPGAGMAELPKFEPAGQVPEPTVVRGVLSLAPAGMTNGHVPMTLLDITGRRVMELVPGDNDVSHLVPGVYCIRVTSGGILASRKLVKVE